MELKRYVMSKSGLIYEVEEQEQVKKCIVFKAKGDNYARYIYDSETDYKTSDDILDLVEVGDLVEDTYGVTAMVVAFGLNGEGGDERVFKCCYVDVLYEDVKAIWKQQGDTMKRYEVK